MVEVVWMAQHVKDVRIKTKGWKREQSSVLVVGVLNFCLTDMMMLILELFKDSSVATWPHTVSIHISHASNLSDMIAKHRDVSSNRTAQGRGMGEMEMI
jgi:hypothetical protein